MCILLFLFCIFTVISRRKFNQILISQNKPVWESILCPSVLKLHQHLIYAWWQRAPLVYVNIAAQLITFLPNNKICWNIWHNNARFGLNNSAYITISRPFYSVGDNIRDVGCSRIPVSTLDDSNKPDVLPNSEHSAISKTICRISSYRRPLQTHPTILMVQKSVQGM